MRWIDRSALMATGLATLLAAAVSRPAWGDTLVVRASGPSAASYPVGRKLPDAAQLRLTAGDAITLIDTRGTRVLRGPGVFSAAATASAVSVPSALTQSDARRVRIGAVRAVSGITASRPSLWMVDVSKPGPVCLLDANAPVLWRPRATASGTVTITPAAGGAPGVASWDAGESSAGWPTSLTAADGLRYRLSGLYAAPVDITVKVIAAPGTDLPRAAAALIDAGCQAQLDQLIATSLRTG